MKITYISVEIKCVENACYVTRYYKFIRSMHGILNRSTAVNFQSQEKRVHLYNF